MNDLLPHKHGDEGTHGACDEMVKKYGDKTKCCTCTGHQCKEPTSKDLISPEFNAVWNAIKKWDIEREHGAGYAGATGTDVMIILNALRNSEAELNRKFETETKQIQDKEWIESVEIPYKISSSENSNNQPENFFSHLKEICEKCHKPIWDNTGIGGRVGEDFTFKDFNTQWCKCQNMTPNNNPKEIENWEGEFDKRFPQFEEYPQAFKANEPDRLKIQSFIRSLLARQREEAYEEGQKEQLEFASTIELKARQELLSEIREKMTKLKHTVKPTTKITSVFIKVFQLLDSLSAKEKI